MLKKNYSPFSFHQTDKVRFSQSSDCTYFDLQALFKSMQVKYILLLATVLSSLHGFTQQVTNLTAYSGQGSVGIEAIHYSNNQILTTGTFDQTLQWGTDITSQGNLDLFLGKRDLDGSLDWIQYGGSDLVESVGGITSDSEGNTYWFASHWSPAIFSDTTLAAGEVLRTLFLAKYDESGNRIWWRSMTGDGLKVPTGIAVFQDQLVVCGHFSDSLYIDPTTQLQASGIEDAFLLSYDLDGNLQWAQRAGILGRTRPADVAFDQEGAIVVGGTFIGEVEFAGDTLATGTPDTDLFTAKWDQDGAILWGRRAGGVFESVSSAIAIDENNDIWHTGFFLGVIRLTDSTQFESNGFNNDIFLIEYDPNGNPIAGRGFGGTGDEKATDILIYDDQVWISAHFDGQSEVDFFSATNPIGKFSSMILGFDQSIFLQESFLLNGSNFVLSSALDTTDRGTLLLGGSFNQQLFTPEQPTAVDLFDGYICEVDFTLVSTLEPATPSLSATVFPNPGLSFSIQSERLIEYWELYSSTGIRVAQGTSANGQSTHLPGGMYWIKIHYLDGEQEIHPWIRKSH